MRRRDDQWLDIARFMLMAMIEAEELGITTAKADEMLNSCDPTIQRFCGVVPGFGKAPGVKAPWAYAIVKQVGNDGEVFERTLGKASPIGLERGLTDLWTRGRLICAIPSP